MSEATTKALVDRCETLTRQVLAAHAPLHASLSPDASTLTITTVHVPTDSVEEVLQLLLLDVATGDTTVLSGAGPEDRLAEWSPNGRRLALLGADDDGETVVLVAEPSGDGRRIVPGTQRADGAPVWAPDSRRLVVPRRRGTVLDRSLPFRWQRPYPAADGVGPLEDPPQLCLVDVDTDEVRWLTDDDWRWATPRWHPTDDVVAATAWLDPDDHLGGQVLRLVQLDGTVEDVGIPGGRAVVARWLDDGRLVALVAEPHGRPSGSAAELYVVAGDDVHQITLEDLFGDVFGDCAAELADNYDTVVVTNGNTLALRAGARGRNGILTIDLGPDGSAEVRAIVDGPRACSPVAFRGDTVVFTRQEPHRFPEIAAIDLSDPALDERRLFGAGELPALPEAERFVLTSADGWELDGWFVAPEQRRGPLPTVVVVHGGPHFTFGEAFSLDVQALCAAGFGVLYTNPRGSTGYGDPFAHAVHGDWAEGPSRDVLAVLDHAVELGWVDPDRVGITGNSYGGYLSAWLASTTGRFAAAVIENPVTDLLGMYGTSDIGRRFFPAQLGGPPQELIDVYVGQSPLLQAHRCQTPCLFVTGELDRRCPPGQTWAMHRVLREVGTPSEVLVLPGSSHEGSTYGPPAGRIAHNTALVEWMARWLLT